MSGTYGIGPIMVGPSMAEPSRINCGNTWAPGVAYAAQRERLALALRDANTLGDYLQKLYPATAEDTLAAFRQRSRERFPI